MFSRVDCVPEEHDVQIDFVVEIQLCGHEIQRVNPTREKVPAGQCAHMKYGSREFVAYRVAKTRRMP